MITISVAAAFLVLLCGIVAIVLAAREHAFASYSVWWFLSYWITALAILGGVVIR